MSKNRNPAIRKDTSSKAKFTQKAKKVKAGTGAFEGIAYESYNELYFLMWAKDLREAGFIESVERAPSYVLTEGFTHVYSESNKRGTSAISKSQILLRPSVYTPEFVVKWNPHKYQDFVWLVGTNCKCIKPLVGHNTALGIQTWTEIKSSHDFENMTRLFINNQKFMYKTHGLFVNLVKIPDIFEKTFTPKAYLYTATGKPRKIKFEIKTLNEFLTK